MRLVFAGTPEFAERILAALVDAGHAICLVLTQPDKPAGRGHKLTESPVKRYARRHGLDVFQPATLKDPTAVDRIAALQPDILAVAAYGLILPRAVLDLPRDGAINVHASLLPRWRGAAPIQRALLAGDSETGVTIMGMEAGLDTGPMYAKRAIPIDASDDAGSLHDGLAELGARMLVEVLEDIASGRAHAEPQPEDGVAYAHKIEKTDLQLDWNRAAEQLARAVRAYRPAPGAATKLAGMPVKIWAARAEAGSGTPGTILRADAKGIAIACGRDHLVVTELQRAGGRRLSAADFLRGCPLAAGDSAL